jgi:hypothetical protein
MLRCMGDDTQLSVPLSNRYVTVSQGKVRLTGTDEMKSRQAGRIFLLMRQLFEICDAGPELSCAKTYEFNNMRRDVFSWQQDTAGTLSISKAIS